ncbi:MAG TPA: glycosyltransferase, partial [Gemmatimonadales bacterium]|nr:glycosyltransferase [Gemmatimonadales bacterium]
MESTDGGLRIVITSWGSYGDVNPYVGLARALHARGHQPVLVMPGYYRGAVEHEGLEFRALRPAVDPADTALVARIMDARRGSEVIIREIMMPSLRESFDDLMSASEGSDLMLTHPITFAAPLAAEVRGIPWISTVLAPMSFFSVHDLPVFPPAPWMAGLRPLGSAAGRPLVALARAATRGWTAPVAALREELGLAPGSGDPLFEGQFSPHGTLALFSPLLGAPQPDWPAGVQVTGHVWYDGPAGGDRLDPALADFLAEGEPPIVFTLGSSAVHNPGRFWAESAEAARQLGRRAVLLVGSDPANAPRALPDGVAAFAHAPYSELLPRGCATVHQGGVGTTAQALRAG